MQLGVFVLPTSKVSQGFFHQAMKMDMDILRSWQSKYGKYFEQDETKHPFCVKHVPRLNEQSFRYLKILCIEDDIRGWKFEIP